MICRNPISGINIQFGSHNNNKKKEKRITKINILCKQFSVREHIIDYNFVAGLFVVAGSSLQSIGASAIHIIIIICGLIIVIMHNFCSNGNKVCGGSVYENDCSEIYGRYALWYDIFWEGNVGAWIRVGDFYTGLGSEYKKYVVFELNNKEKYWTSKRS